MALLLRILAVAYFVALPAACQTMSSEETSSSAFTDENAFRVWFAFYYQNPKPDELSAALSYMEAHDYLSNFPDIASIFLSEAMRPYPDRFAAWAKDWESLGPKSWKVIVIALWLENTDASRQLATQGLSHIDAEARDQFATMLKRDPSEVDLMNLDVKDPRQINMLWAAFSATGKDRYVDKVISYVAHYGDRDDERMAKVGEAAVMTLATNALQHPLVARACGDAQASHPNPRTRTLLRAMLKAVAQILEEGGSASRPAH